MQGSGIYGSRARCGSFDDGIWLADKSTVTFLKDSLSCEKIILLRKRFLVLKVSKFYQDFAYIISFLYS